MPHLSPTDHMNRLTAVILLLFVMGMAFGAVLHNETLCIGSVSFLLGHLAMRAILRT